MLLVAVGTVLRHVTVEPSAQPYTTAYRFMAIQTLVGRDTTLTEGVTARAVAHATKVAVRSSQLARRHKLGDCSLRLCQQHKGWPGQPEQPCVHAVL